MDYNLAKVVPSEVSYTLDEAMPYGQMPDDALVSRFEETDMGNDEDLYDGYARGVLVDRRPDQNKFEHEEARGGVTRSSGRLNLQYYGHRGSADDPAHPEMFLGEGGPESHDPRGINVDPDMKQLRTQENARMRFIRWDKDHADFTTGGGRSESQVMADQQKLFRVTRDRLKVFDRQIDGRREGVHRTYKHKSNIPKQVLVQSYGDYIKDYALNPQRRANIICKQILRNSKSFRDETADTDFVVAKYSQLCRRAQTKTKHRSVVTAKLGSDGQFSDGDASKHFKTCGLLMANIIKGKRQGISIAKNSDMDFAEAKHTVCRKTQPFQRDLGLILRAMAVDSNFAVGDATITMKSAAPMAMKHLARQVVYNHSTPAHHYLNAEVLFKSVKPGADTRKIKDLVITDANAPELRDLNTIGGKTAKMRMISGAKLKTSDDTDKCESTNTVNYRTKLTPNGDRRIRVTSGEEYKKESDNSQNRRPNHTNYKNPDARDHETGIKFSDNSQKERHTASMGTKYMVGFIDRDARESEQFGS